MTLQAAQLSVKQFSGPGKTNASKTAQPTANSAFGAALAQQSPNKLQVSDSTKSDSRDSLQKDLQLSGFSVRQPDADGNLEVSDANSVLSEAAGLQFFYLQPFNVVANGEEPVDSAGSIELSGNVPGVSAQQAILSFPQADKNAAASLSAELTGLPENSGKSGLAVSVSLDTGQIQTSGSSAASDTGIAVPVQLQQGQNNMPDFNPVVSLQESSDKSQPVNENINITNVIVQPAESAMTKQLEVSGQTNVLPMQTEQPVLQTKRLNLEKEEAITNPEKEPFLTSEVKAGERELPTADQPAEQQEMQTEENLLSEKKENGTQKKEGKSELLSEDISGESALKRLDFSRGVIQVSDASSKLDQSPVQQVADQVKLLINQEQSEYELQLSPESLGKVSVKLTMNDGVMTVAIAAQNPKTQEMIRAGSHEIASILKDSGAAQSDVVVTVNQSDQSSGQHTAYQEQESSGQRGAYQQRQNKQNSSSAAFEAMLLNLKMEGVTETAV